MIYDLNLNFPVGCFRKIDETKRKLIKEKLESITSFQQRLSYYNNEIRSLSIYEKRGAQIYYEWGLPDQKVKVFCNCNNCRSKPHFDESQERMYEKARTKEIKRLVTGVKKQSNYKDKLSLLFNTKGYNPNLTPAVWDNHNEEPIIDLRPKTKKEIQILNEFVIDSFESKYRNGKGFTAAYNGFELEKEKQGLNERLQQPATDKPVLLRYIKAEIEKHFSYPKSLHTDKKEKHISAHVLKQIDRQLKDMGQIDKLFERLNFGEKIDLSSVTGLDSNSLLHYTHVSEIFRFYQYVKELQENPKQIEQLTREGRLKSISENKELVFYTVEKNIPNQNLVQDTITYFETGEGARVFKPLEFLNLFEKQYQFLKLNYNDGQKVLQTLKSLSLNHLEKHILYGLILKWTGGYPVNNLDEDFDKTLKLIQKEFLSYKGETPEKEFCKADKETQKEFMKLGIALTTAINNNIDAKHLYNAMQDPRPEQKSYSSFDELFEDAVRNNAIGEFANQEVYLIRRSHYNFEFNIWLQETKGWEYGNEKQYQKLLSKDLFIEFLRYEKEQQHINVIKFEKEKESWKIEIPQEKMDLNPIIKSISERTELQNFLSVPAPEILHSKAFWHDENNRPIDCNIYHPKYGYPGFETSTRDSILTSFNPLTIYQDDKTGKQIYCQYYWQILCSADEKTFTNKDGIKIIKVDHLQKNQTRLAETNHDFELIYQREFISEKLPNSPEIKAVFCKEVINHIQQLIELHKERSNYKEGRDIKVLALANRFIEYINSIGYQQHSAKREQLSAPVIALFCRLINDTKLMERKDSESVESYCGQVCHNYNLAYTDRVRQTFNGSNTKGNRKKLIELLLPIIDKKVSLIITDYLNSKDHLKQNLYG